MFALKSFKRHRDEFGGNRAANFFLERVLKLFKFNSGSDFLRTFFVMIVLQAQFIKISILLVIQNQLYLFVFI